MKRARQGFSKKKTYALREIALTSKTNIVFDIKTKEGTTHKITAKGGQKRRNARKLTWNNYERALNRCVIWSTNAGFRMHNRLLTTYCKTKDIFTPINTKAVILADGLHIRPFTPDELKKMRAPTPEPELSNVEL